MNWDYVSLFIVETTPLYRSVTGWTLRWPHMNMPDSPPTYTRGLRILFGVAAAVAAIALALHASNWLRSGAVQWGPAANISGLLILMLTGAFNVPRGVLRNACSVAGVGLVLVGAAIVYSA